MEKFINQSPLFLVIICLIIGFAFLMKGADYFVEGSSGCALTECLYLNGSR